MPQFGALLASTLLLFAAFIGTCICGSYDPQRDGPVDASIANLKRVIGHRSEVVSALQYTSAEDDLWLASAYKNLGLMLQSKGIRQHLGGDRLQREALDNYNIALSIDKGRTVSLNVQINYLKGMLLKMMGFGEDSLEAYAKALEYYLSDHDRASIYFHKADTLAMLGQKMEAKLHFHQALQLRPCRTERYYQYVNACKDLDAFSKQDWLDLLDEVQRRVKDCESSAAAAAQQAAATAGDGGLKPAAIGDGKESDNADDVYIDEVDEEEDEKHSTGTAVAVPSSGSEGAAGPESYLLLVDSDYASESTAGGGHSGPNSAVYWALYIAAEKAGRPALAWWYLEHANSLEKSLREGKFSREDAAMQAHQVTGAFTVELLDSLSFMRGGKASKVPIFIVGFMR